MPPENAGPALPDGLRVLSFTSPSDSLSRSVNAYLIEGDSPLLIDSGFEHAELNISGLLRDEALRDGRLLLTHLHRDHAGGVLAASACGFAVEFHPLEIDLYGDRVAGLGPVRHLEDGETLNLPFGRLTALHTPGHSPGHLCFHWEEEGILFSGDLITGEPSSWVGPPDGNMTEYLDSLRRVARLPVRLILSGHGKPVEKHPEAIQAYIQRRLDREAEVLGFLGGGPLGIPDLTQRLYRSRGLSPRMMGFAEKTVEAHLIKLIGEGRARRSGEGLYSLP